MGRMKLLSITRSPKEGKKWRATFNNDGRQKHTDFGSAGMQDFTLSKDPAQAQRYRNRHQKDLDTNDPTRAGYLAYYILWASPNFDENVRAYKRKFGL
jgi:hypothetical protein